MEKYCSSCGIKYEGTARTTRCDDCQTRNLGSPSNRRCKRCGNQIDDLDEHPRALTCSWCRANWQKTWPPAPIEKLPRLCEECGIEIIDLKDHPRARYCKACREERATRKPTRNCTRCGSPIDGLEINPYRRLCFDCRESDKIRFCARCGKKIINFKPKSRVRLCDECRGIRNVPPDAPKLVKVPPSKVAVPSHEKTILPKQNIMCDRCGGEIRDIGLYPTAKLCAWCRGEVRNPIIRTTLRYGEQVKARVDEMGWPKFIQSKGVLLLYPDVLGVEATTKWGKPLTKAGSATIIGLCVCGIRDKYGRGYIRYSSGSFILVSSEEYMAVNKWASRSGFPDTIARHIVSFSAESEMEVS